MRPSLARFLFGDNRNMKHTLKIIGLSAIGTTLFWIAVIAGLGVTTAGSVALLGRPLRAECPQLRTVLRIGFPENGCMRAKMQAAEN
jgi:hypothetical protein